MGCIPLELLSLKKAHEEGCPYRKTNDLSTCNCRVAEYMEMKHLITSEVPPSPEG